MKIVAADFIKHFLNKVEFKSWIKMALQTLFLKTFNFIFTISSPIFSTFLEKQILGSFADLIQITFWPCTLT